MNLKCAILMAAGLWAVAGPGIAHAAAITAVVNFDPPANQQGPSIYVAVPGPQTIATTPATFSGGAILGFATFFPAIAFATAPNVYGTADFGNSLSHALTIATNPAFATNEVSFALFNGEPFNQSYTVDAFNGTTLVASQTLTDVAPNFNAGFGLVDLNSLTGITSVNIAPAGPLSRWDFLIDTVAFNQSITTLPNAPPPTPVVLPPAPPVQGHRHGQAENETELVEVDFGDDVNDIRGSTVVVTPSTPTTPTPSTNVPEPGTYTLVIAGLLGVASLRRNRPAA
jgi:hypothetical protein